MFDASAEYYDLLYSTFKDYAAGTAAIAALLRRLNPDCRTVLTTGEMMDAFRRAGLEVEHDPKGLTDRGLFVGRRSFC